jgi:nanoRNase/pAp phosphatase (c-di-AMP/oligoRNAs hydrolase)
MTMRIVTRPDFDGIVCAALLQDFIPETAGQGIYWVEPGSIQNRQVSINEGDILANLPYHEQCTMWFDHHVTNRIETPFSGAFAIAPSAARVIYDHYASQFLEKHHELVVQADKIDSADLTEDEVVRPESNPFVLLSMTISGRRETDEPYWNSLVSLLRHKPIAEVMKDPDVAERCREVSIKNTLYREQLIQRTKLYGTVAVTDFRSYATAPEGNRFLPYSLFKDAVVSVKIRYDQKDKDYVILSVGHSIFNRNCKVNAGILLSRYNGGGHFGAAACRFHVDYSERYIAEIIDILTKNEPIENPRA